MNQNEIMIIIDEFGIINEAEKILSTELKLKLISAIAELENKNCYKTNNYPITKLHKVIGIDKNIYRAYVDKISGWRLHVQQSKEFKNTMILKQIVDGVEHDNCLRIIKSQKARYDTSIEPQKKQ